MTLQLLIQLGCIAIIVAFIPLMVTSLRGNRLSFHRFTWLILFCTFDLILFGAFTRLTDSGLGCPDWPGCYGHSNPLSAIAHIQEAQSLMPSGPVTISKAWIEMLHRYFASGVGFLILMLLGLAWIKRNVLGKPIFYTSMGLFLLVCLQGAFGAFTVTLKLQPIIVTTHLLLALCLIMGLAALTEVTHEGFVINCKNTFSSARKLSFIVLIICFFQICLGAWVSTNYAVLACQGFPSCNGELLPKMDFGTGFSIWRPLGMTSEGGYITAAALVAIHWVHRLGALITSFAVLYFWFYLGRQPLEDSGWQQRVFWWRRMLLLVLIAQLLSGLSNVVLNWPMIGALAHTGGAALLLICLTKLCLLSLSKPEHV